MSNVKANEGSQPRTLGSALNEAQSIIEAAENRAQELRRAAEGAFEDAKRSGFEAGFQQGLRDAAGTAIRLVGETSVLSQHLSEEAAKLAVAICQTVIAEHVRVDPSLVRKIAERALQQSVVGDSISIVCHPDDLPVLNQSLDSLRRIAGGAHIQLEAAEHMPRGGCLVRTEFGEVDASVPSLIDGIAAHLGITRR